MLLGFSHRHRGEPQHKTLSFFFSCNRNPEETPLESALQEVNYWTPPLWLWPVLAFGSTMKSWVAKQLACWQLQLREDHCAHCLLHAHDGSSVKGKYCSYTGCLLLLLLVAMQSAVWNSRKQQFAPVAEPSFSYFWFSLSWWRMFLVQIKACVLTIWQKWQEWHALLLSAGLSEL